MSSLSTDLSVNPYYDDYDEAKGFHRILFRPTVAVQARELTQLQTILQTQIERFGDNIFVSGTVIRGCNFQFDSQYSYIKLPDLRIDGVSVNPSAYQNLVAYDATSNLQAKVVNGIAGYESQNPDMNTLYIKYINSGNTGAQAFAPDTVLTFYANSATTTTGAVIANNYQASLDVKVAPATIASVNTNPVGTGYAFSVGEGIIFQKGHFIKVANTLTTIVSKYSPTPNNVSVGFTTLENIITENADTSLLDNAAGYANKNAPGAHRLQLVPTLTTVNSNAIPNSGNNFLTLVDWKNGNPVRVNQNTQYNKLGDELARREYETSGDFVVRKFKLASEKNLANTSNFNLIVGAGLGYVSGYRMELQNASRVALRKGNDTKSLTSQSVSTSYGNYVLAKDMAGSFTIGSSINLYDAATSPLTNTTYATISPSGNVIGTAVVLSVVFDSGTTDTPSATYRIYLTNILLNSGKSFSLVKGIGNSSGIADLVLEYNATSNTNVAILKDPTNSKAVFYTGKSSVKTLRPSNTVSTSFVYRKNDMMTFNANGTSTPITLSGNTVFPYGVGNLSSTQERSIIVIPTSTQNVVTAYTGNVVTTAGSANVVGTATSFLSQYQPNDYIYIATDIRRIVSIANDTFLTAANTFSANTTNQTHKKCYPKNVPINFSDRNSFINQSNTTSLSMTLVGANGVTETVSNTFAASVYYNAKAITTAAIQKTSNQNKFVCIDTALNTPLSGTVSGNTTSAVLTGVGTSFSSLISPGYLLYLANTTSNAALIGTVSSVTNATSLTLTSNASALITANAITYSAPGSMGVAGPWPLGVPDAYRLRNVYKVSSSNTFSNAASNDVTSEFVIQPNQTDTVYNISALAKRPGSSLTITSGDKIVAVFDAFTIPVSSGVGFFSIDSYPIDDANTANTTAIQTQYIPFYTDSAGNVLSLRDQIDFRSYVANTIPLASNLTSASVSSVINPSGNNVFSSSGFIAPDESFGYDVSYYLGRVDKLLLNASGQFNIIEGIPSESPKAPTDQIAALNLGTVSIPPYPSLLSSDIDSSTKNFPTVAIFENQNRRYTMKDIDSISKRVTDLEYYSSLSLLEMSTNNLTIKSDITGHDRFKNGIFVDNFESPTSGNPSDAEYSISRNPKETSIIPNFQQFKIELKYDTNTNAGNATISKTGDLVTLNYTETPLFTQGNATRVRNCTEGFYNWGGTLTTVPTYDSYVDVRNQPVQQVINNITNISDTYNTTNITSVIQQTVTNSTTTINNGQPAVAPTTPTQPAVTPWTPPVVVDPLPPTPPAPTTPFIQPATSARSGVGGGPKGWNGESWVN